MTELETSYGSALQDIAQYLPAVSPALVGKTRRQILALWEQFETRPTAEVLGHNRLELKKELQDFAARSDSILETQEKQFKDILKSFAEAAATLAKQSQVNDGRLTGFTRNLETLIGLKDLSELRTRLAAEVAELRRAVAEMHDASQTSVKQLRAELCRFREKLAVAEESARTDSLTGLHNRRSGEQALRIAIARCRPFCIVMIDLNGFKGINDRWGHQAGDVVLKEFADRLAGSVRSGDMVCRWGGDEFLVLLYDCSLSQASARAVEFRRACEGEYRLIVLEKPISLLLRTAQGVVEWQLGKSAEQLLRLADEQLYREKGKVFAA
ncbi:MAG TPA: GGDEF domain-containing protein [Bryobacteraceae bacterium]|nr:GGDEF domain-containing protein [Bryobacteraceae bacterium]